MVSRRKQTRHTPPQLNRRNQPRPALGLPSYLILSGFFGFWAKKLREGLLAGHPSQEFLFHSSHRPASQMLSLHDFPLREARFVAETIKTAKRFGQPCGSSVNQRGKLGIGG